MQVFNFAFYLIKVKLHLSFLKIAASSRAYTFPLGLYLLKVPQALEMLFLI